MKPAPTPKDEAGRLEALKAYEIIDSAPEKEFDDIAKIATQICGTPISLISLIDEERQWFKSTHGLDITDSPRAIAFCAHTIADPDNMLIVNDASKDERFAENPFVIGDPPVMYYAGAPLVTSDGHALGTICVIDNIPRDLSKEQLDALEALSNQVMRLFELRKINSETNRSKMLYQHLVESADDYVYEVNQKGIFSYCNPQILKDTGFSKAELSKLHYTELVHPMDRQRVSEFYLNQVGNQEIESYIEFRVKTKDAAAPPIYIGQKANISYTDDGKLSRVWAIARNITKEVALSKERDEKEALYRLISESAQDIICLHDLDGTYKYVSPSVKDNLGYEPSELLGKTPFDFMHEEDKARVTQEAHKPLKEGTKQNITTYRLQHKNGKYLWFESSSTSILDKHNKVTSIRSSTRNINVRKKQEEIINEQNHKLESFVAATPAAVAMFDRKIRYLAYSEKWKSTYGLEDQEITGKTHYEIFPEIGDDWKVIHQECLKGATRKMDEELFKRANGDDQWIKWEVRPWFEKNGKVGGIIMLTDDITELKKQEFELIEAKDKAEIASEAKANFLSVMSHEIRTPLNAIIGLSHILLQESPRQDQSESLNTIRFSSENLLSLVNDILDYNKIESGKIDLENIHFNLRELVTNIKQAQSYKAAEKAISLKLLHDQDLPTMLKGDPTRLAQILNNLLSNAIKFTRKGFVRFTIEEKKRTEDRVTIYFEITDSGIGISKENQKRIFDRFTQAESDITRHFGGTGLGLAITKQLLEVMGSSIKVESELGQGAKFSFELELQISKNEENLKGSGLNFSSQLESLQSQNISVLLVEDNKANQLVAKKFLTNWGISVDIANDGFEALEYITTEKYHLILMDLQMPKKDGFTTSQEIRSIEGDYYLKVPIIALTASSDKETFDKTNAFGMDDMITKPFIPAELYKKIVKFALKPESHLITSSPNQNDHMNSDLISHLNIYSEGDDEFLLELVEGLCENLQDFILRFPEFINDGNEAKAKFLLHKMRNSLLMTGSNEIIALGEEAIRLMANDGADRTLIELREKSEELMRQLSQMLKEE